MQLRKCIGLIGSSYKGLGCRRNEISSNWCSRGKLGHILHRVNFHGLAIVNGLDH
jgi:hypothetical protein